MQPVAHEQLPNMIPPKLRLILGFMLSIIVLLAIAGAVSIPFYFESSSILYKFGTDKRLLRSGQVIGMVAACLLLLQIILGARLKYLDRIFGLSNLFRFHRIAGLIIGCLIIVHPVMIFIPENRFFIPFELRYWPEFVGLFLLLMIIFTVISSHWRGWLKLSFHRWWRIHQWTAVLIIIALWTHALSVSATFEQKLPQVLAYSSIILCGLVFFWIRTRFLRDRRRSFRVSVAEPAGKDALRLEIVTDTKNQIGYAPGQFCFFTLFSNHISREEHPFSFTSTPTRTSCLEIAIRTTGDWTSRLNDIQPGDRILLNGPFGLFSHLQLPDKQEIIMIAGGIGITPILGMLRYMADCNDQRKITLIWSNQTRKHIIFPDEFKILDTHLKGLRIFHVLTRDPEFRGENGRLDRPKLKRLLSDCSRSSAVFVCGPQKMMKEVRYCLISLNFSRRMFFMERFSL